MGWMTEDGLHEGYVVPVFADGVRGAGISGGGIPDDQVIVGSHYDDSDPSRPTTHYETRPAAEAIGWCIACACRDRSGLLLDPEKQWVSALLARVPSRSLEDVSGGRIYAADEDVIYVADGGEVEEQLRRRWTTEHAGGREALARVVAAQERVRQAEHELDAAVAEARASGAVWEDIAVATGMKRQSAHARWRDVGERELRAARRRVDAAIGSLGAAPGDVPQAEAMRARLAEPDVADAVELLRASAHSRRSDQD